MAGNTLNLALPYPSGGDGNDVPYWLQALGEAVDAIVGGAWMPVTPTFYNFVPGANTSVQSRVKKVGKSVDYAGLVILGAGFSMNSNPLGIALPFPVAGVFNNILSTLGVSMLNDSGSSTAMGMITVSTGSSVYIRTVAGAAISIATPFAWAAGDSFSWNVRYETSV